MSAAYSSTAADQHVSEATSLLREWGYEPDDAALRRIFSEIPDSIQRRSNAWRTVVRIWVEEPERRQR